MLKMAAMLIACTASLSGCIAKTPNDLKFEKVTWVGPGGLEARTGLGTVRDQPFLRVEFTSNVNLLHLVLNNGFSLRNSSFFCHRQEQEARLSFPGVYWNGEKIWAINASETIQRGAAMAGPMTYYIFLKIADIARPANIPPEVAFDLGRSPEDICFRVAGGALVRGYSSNVVFVPGQAIAAALTAAELQ